MTVVPLEGVTGEQVAAFIGAEDDPDMVALAGHSVRVVSAMAKRYCRGNGFAGGQVESDLAAVILAASARLVANPEQVDSQVGTASIRGGFKGWTLAERAVLNEYRQVAR